MLVGRGAETATIGRLLAEARDGRSNVLVVRGEAGVGKSALLEYAGEQAAGFTVLRGAGIEAEAELTYAALHQLLRPVFDRIDRLPGPQAAALRAAFALSDETVDERFRVSLGVLGLLAEAAAEQPLLCLVDDAQWLDQASADALLFAARRLEAEAVVLVLAVRDDDRAPWIARGLAELRLSGLGPTEARQLVAEQLGSGVRSDVVEWLVEHANGNPLALVELPGSLTADQLEGEVPLVGRVPPATSVEQVYADRVAGLPPGCQRLLLLAAADESGSRATVERAAHDLGLEMSDLEAAESAGLVRVEPVQLNFRHPLVRAAVYRAAVFTERELAHRTLAVATAEEGSADRAAWHRAAATIGSDEAVARELEQTAERARLRSGHAGAAAALERAAELSPDAAVSARRLLAGANAAWRAGRPERATAMLDRADPHISEPRMRAELDNLRGVVEWRCGSVPAACTQLMAGADVIGPIDPSRALEMFADAALACWDGGDYPRMAAAARAAASLPRSDQEVHRLLVDVLVAAVDRSHGLAPPASEQLRDVLARAADIDDQRLLIWAAIAAEMAGERTLEIGLLERAAAFARASGAVDRLTEALESTVVEGFLGGNFTITVEASEGLRLAREAGLPNAANLHLASLAWLSAVTGRSEACRGYAAEVVEAARPNGHAISASIAQWALALLDLGGGRPGQAALRLTQLSTAPPGIGHPFYVLSSAPDLVEACVRSDRPAEAAAAATLLAEFTRSGTPTWAMALAARCRAMLTGGDAAETEYRLALQLHDESRNPFDRARTELLYGEFLRRERRRTDAREPLRAAVNLFEGLGAEPWAERARTELRATGETARRRDPSTLEDLTPQEMQIARLVGGGSSNKDIAAQLFLSPRTVEYHLRKVFAKLGISSRAHLIRDGVPLQREPSSSPV